MSQDDATCWIFLNSDASLIVNFLIFIESSTDVLNCSGLRSNAYMQSCVSLNASLVVEVCNTFFGNLGENFRPCPPSTIYLPNPYSKLTTPSSGFSCPLGYR